MGFETLKDWIGRSEALSDVATAAPLVGLAATLDHEDPPWPVGQVPPLGHWLYFLPRALQREIAGDGHPHRGGFLPPVPLPRRMWAGGELQFLAPIPVGSAIRRTSTIQDVTHKPGRSGDMVFVKVRHEIATDTASGASVAVREIHDIVYREAAKPGETAPVPAPEEPRRADVSRTVTPDPVLLFRYSALTFNGHRIHYDRTYCREEEGYPGLIVHGPLTATLLLDLFLRQGTGKRVTGFRFRARRPLFDTRPFSLHLAWTTTGADAWALDPDGFTAMTAEIEAAS